MDLGIKYKTGRSLRRVEIKTKKDIIHYTYEFTIVTESGQYKEKDWIKLVEKQSIEKFEVNILEKLSEYCINNLAWINTEKEAYNYALELYSNRIWENKSWVGYEEFNTSLKDSKVFEQISLI